jgi:hypothetical protein
MHYILASVMDSYDPMSDLPLSFVLAVIGSDDEHSDLGYEDLPEADSEFEALV